jgi:hypothetical protein
MKIRHKFCMPLFSVKHAVNKFLLIKERRIYFKMRKKN